MFRCGFVAAIAAAPKKKHARRPGRQSRQSLSGKAREPKIDASQRRSRPRAYCVESAGGGGRESQQLLWSRRATVQAMAASIARPLQRARCRDAVFRNRQISSKSLLHVLDGREASLDLINRFKALLAER
ncbi:hypothetical protein [Bradyrhizobium manausense]|uniref:hypothetical protein n=1 Tax=Bradyrhizobium manausense TaxID=989370 RepID=UPI001BA5ECD2|nr:hypothetical protein [Bradyrhizobium manausense]